MKQYIFHLAVVVAAYVITQLVPERPLDPSFQTYECFWGAIIGAAFQVAGTVAANAHQNKAIKQQRKALGEEIAEERAAMNSNYLDRADSQAALREVRQFNKDQLASLSTEGIKRGMADEAKIAAAGRLNKNYSDVVSRLGALGAQYRDRARERMLGAKRNLAQVDYSTAMAQAQGVGQGLAGAGSAAQDIWEAIAKQRNIGK